MIDNGIGCDVISMTSPPLHSVPLFRYRDRGGNVNVIPGGKGASYTSPVTEGSFAKNSYDIPHWLHISFYGSYKYPTQPWRVDRGSYPVQGGREGEKRILVPKEGIVQVS